MDRMIERYKADSIQFVSISIDNDPGDWKRALIKHGPMGVELSDPVGYTGLSAVYCKVQALPTFIIADQQGHIVNYNAPQAVDPELKTVLDGLLHKPRRGR
jgi:hypothetical protein